MITYDPVKREANLAKHGIDFADVTLLFEGPMLVKLDDRRRNDEDRWVGLGWMLDLCVCVVFVERHRDVIRILSARKATRYEEESFYEQIFKN